MTIAPTMPAGSFNISVKSKIAPMSVLPVFLYFRKCYWYSKRAINITVDAVNVKYIMKILMPSPVDKERKSRVVGSV